MAQQGAKSNESPNSELLFNAPPRLLLATNLGQMTDSAILQQSLSLKSVISTTSSFGRLFQTARTRPDLQQLNQIGASLQGAVFEQAGKPLALKKKKIPGNEKLPSNLYREYTIHRDVSTAFEHYQSINRKSMFRRLSTLSLGKKTTRSGMKSYQKLPRRIAYVATL